MKDLGYGKGYRYAHDEEDAYAAGERYFPDDMPDVRWYAADRSRARGEDPREARRLRARDAQDAETSAAGRRRSVAGQRASGASC